MKNLKSVKKKRIMALVLILLISVLFLSPYQLSAGVCSKALSRCSVDAIIVTIFSGPGSGILYLSECFIGYDWCQRYYLVK